MVVGVGDVVVVAMVFSYSFFNQRLPVAQPGSADICKYCSINHDIIFINFIADTCKCMIQIFWCWTFRLRKYSLTNEKWFFLFFMCNFGAYSGASLLKFPPSQAISCHCAGHYFYLHFLMPANPSAELRSRFKMACSASSYTSY